MTRVNFSVCPFCSAEHDASTAVVKNPAPVAEPVMTPGDATLCIACGEFCIVGDDGMLRRPRRAEARRLERSPNVQRMRRAWADFRASRKPLV